jgi:glucose/arabinose dehydrogenase
MMRLACLIAATLAVAPTGLYAAQTDAPPPEAASRVKTETIAGGLSNPWALQFLPDGRLLVTERPGRLRIVTKDGKIGPAIAGVPDVFAKGQGGLLDVLLAKDFGASGGMIYFSYSEPRGEGAAATAVARARLQLDSAGGGKLEEVKTIFQQEPAIASSIHFGSRLAWAPDGTLFVTTGDRGNAREEVQKPKTFIGKVLNLKPDGSAGQTGSAHSGWDAKLWSIGHRNIQGAAVDPQTGQLWTVEHGARGGDELNLTERGKNYGWPVISYSNEYFGGPIGEGTSKTGLEQPVYYWVPSIATSGLAIYSGDLFPGWKGNIFVGGLKGAQLSRLVLKDGQVVAEETLLEDLDQRIRDVREGPDGALWVLTDDSRDGQIVRISPKP